VYSTIWALRACARKVDLSSIIDFHQFLNSAFVCSFNVKDFMFSETLNFKKKGLNMRKVTRIRRSVRAISPVISILLMIAIAVVASLVAYAWVMGYLDFATTKVGKAIQIQSVSNNPSPAAYVQNVGDSNVTLNSCYINGNLDALASAQINGVELAKSKTRSITEFTFADAFNAKQVTVKIVTSDGTSTEYTETFSGSTLGGTTPQLPQVLFVSAGTADGSPGSSNDPTPSYPTDLQVNDLILLQVTVRHPSTSIIVSTPSGFNLLYGPDSTGNGRQWIYYRFSTGSESGTLSIDVSGSVSTAARMYAFRNVALSSFTEDGVFLSNYGYTVYDQSVTTTGDKRLAVSFVYVTENYALDSFSGEEGTGYDWTEAVTEFEYDPSGGEDATIQLQIATMATVGTIDGGSYYMGSGNDASWGVRAFALIPG
jgi:FlaG/FlaF family flagellin (archaellin)